MLLKLSINAIGLEEGPAVSVSVPNKSWLARSKINEVLEINVLQNVAPMLFTASDFQENETLAASN